MYNTYHHIELSTFLEIITLTSTLHLLTYLFQLIKPVLMCINMYACIKNCMRALNYLGSNVLHPLMLYVRVHVS